MSESDGGSGSTTPTTSARAQLLPAGSLPPPPAPPIPPNRPGLARRLWPVVAVVVVLVVILSLFASGALGPSSSSTSSSTPTFATASVAAQSAANATPGGPWILVTAVGVDTSTGATVNTTSTARDNCSFSPVGSSPIPTMLEIPAFHGQFSSGRSPAWGMVYLHASTQQVLLVGVFRGVAAALAVGSPPCLGAFGNLTGLHSFTPVPSHVVDSSASAAIAWNDGGSAFVAAHPSLSLNLEMGLVGGGSYGGLPIGPSWGIVYSPCALSGSGGPSGSQPEYYALVNATTGAVLVSSATQTTCSSSSSLASLGTVLALGEPSETWNDGAGAGASPLFAGMSNAAVVGSSNPSGTDCSLVAQGPAASPGTLLSGRA